MYLQKKPAIACRLRAKENVLSKIFMISKNTYKKTTEKLEFN